MTSPELENLVRAGKLKREPPAAGEIEGLRHSGEARLADAQRPELSIESRFDLAYNAAHVLALAALRRLGFRSENRYLVFQARCQILSGSCLQSGEFWPRVMKSGILRNTKDCDCPGSSQPAGRRRRAAPSRGHSPAAACLFRMPGPHLYK